LLKEKFNFRIIDIVEGRSKYDTNTQYSSNDRVIPTNDRTRDGIIKDVVIPGFIWQENNQTYIHKALVNVFRHQAAQSDAVKEMSPSPLAESETYQENGFLNKPHENSDEYSNQTQHPPIIANESNSHNLIKDEEIGTGSIVANDIQSKNLPQSDLVEQLRYVMSTDTNPVIFGKQALKMIHDYILQNHNIPEEANQFLRSHDWTISLSSGNELNSKQEIALVNGEFTTPRLALDNNIIMSDQEQVKQ
jgi:hypothetical protein